ncbi:MAG TPA: peptidase M6 [Prevotella sp.]|nr:peptidase M6 [Prevotella sp.]
MRKLLLSTIAACLWVMQGAAQEGNEIILPHGKCGTSMIIEQKRAANGIASRAIGSFYPSYVPHTGSIAIPVILVNFNDVHFSINKPREAFEQFFNGTEQKSMGNGNAKNHGSVAQYFSEMSSGAFTPTFKIYDPVTLDQNETYYGGDTHGSNAGENPRGLVIDAIAKLQSSSEKIDDATSFCADGNSVDCVYIIYAGVGQNYSTYPNATDDVATAVWANTGSISGSLANKSLRWYSMAGELTPVYLNSNEEFDTENGTVPCIAGVGVTCHELSHALGLPDFYPTSASAQVDNQEMEYWDLMDGGEYGANGFYPTAYTAWEKQQMGWPVDIQELSSDQQVTIANSTEKGGTAYKITNPDNKNEYFMLESIQQKGWNSYQYGNGLLVYHVNEPNNGTVNIFDRYNNTKGYPGMAVVPADGACQSSYLDANKETYYSSLRGDLFPGTGNGTNMNVMELSDTNVKPNWCWYNSDKTEKLPTNKALRNITYDTSTGIVSFDYVHDTTTGIKGVERNEATTKRIYTLDGRYVGQDFNVLPHGIYIIGGKKIVK